MMTEISIHALLAESDGRCRCWVLSDNHFYPRSPCGERLAPVLATGRKGYFYPRSPCGERHNQNDGPSFSVHISIHALLAESDDTWARGSRVTYVISIHALLAESDQYAYKGV